ncbi:MAG: trypsin-like peptidase domain-containing protein [Planctomycetes bacterium]|nr:trypsin-like peptidase domain-containing protein [Planctomycetota bacterium]
MLSLSTWTLLAALGAGGETVLLDFTAQWCGPCRSMAPAIQRLQAEGYPVRQIDIDQHPQLAAQYGVQSVPCFVMLADGREVDRVVGATSYGRLSQMIRAARPRGEPAGAGSAIRGQSPDRVPFGGRLRQMVGGLRGDASKPNQPATPPPPAIESPSLPTSSAPGYEAGPEPPEALREYAQPAAEAAPAAQDIPAMAASFGGAPQQGQVGQAPQPLAMSQPGSAAASGGSPEERAMAASVRLKIDDGQFFSYATGTIIAVQPDGEALILTCGHVFRDSQGRGAIAVELFGPQRQGPMPGRLVAYDLNRDLGIVSIRLSGTADPVQLAGAEAFVRENMRTFSIGCDRGAEPTIREGRITGVNRYLGTPNLEASGRPVVGRSGGGLFDAAGSLIGVCRAADSEADEGVYVSYQAIRDQLQEWRLGDILRTSPEAPLAQQPVTPIEPARSEQPLAAGASSLAADQPADFDYTTPPAGYAARNGVASPAAAGASLQSPLYIVRSRSGGASDVMLLEQPSAAFLEQLAQEQTVPVGDAAPVRQAVRAALEQGRLTQRGDGPVVRGQSPLQQNAVYRGGAMAP